MWRGIALLHHGHRNRIAHHTVDRHLHRNAVSGRCVLRDHGVDLPQTHETGRKPAEQKLRGDATDGDYRRANGFFSGLAAAACPAGTDGVTTPAPVAQMVIGLPRRAGLPGSFRV